MSLPISLTVDKASNRVIFAEVDAALADVLFCFLTLPISTVGLLARGDDASAGADFLPSCVRNLYRCAQSAEFVHASSKDMLLRPRHSAEEQLCDAAVDIDRERTVHYYTCGSDCLSPYAGVKCSHGTTMDKVLQLDRPESRCSGAFLKGYCKYLVTDDWTVFPASTDAVLYILDQHGVDGGAGDLDETKLQVGRSEIFALLKRSLLSDTTLTDVFLGENEFIRPPPRQDGYLPAAVTAITAATSAAKIHVKLFVDKENKKVMYAECMQDFVDLLLSFLTYPTGAVVKILNGESGIACFDNLYRSAVELPDHQFRDPNQKAMLTSPALLPSLLLDNHLIGVVVDRAVATTERYYMCSRSECTSNDVSFSPDAYCRRCSNYCNFKHMRLVGLSKQHGDGSKYVRPETYTVADDLTVSRISSAALLEQHRSARARGGVTELPLSVGEDEALRLLKASFCSTTALTDAFISSPWVKGERDDGADYEI